jgi:hypothetical protein
MISIDANLADLQSCVEAGSRAVDNLADVAAALSGNGNARVAEVLTHHATELQVCVRGQRGALRELHESIATLKLNLSTVTP